MSTAKCVESRMLASGGVGLAVGLGVMRRIRKTNFTRRLGGVGWSFLFFFPSSKVKFRHILLFFLGTISLSFLYLMYSLLLAFSSYL